LIAKAIEAVVSILAIKNPVSWVKSGINSGATQATITVIAAYRAPLPHTFAADSTLTDHSKTKCLLTLKTRLCFLKSEEGPLNLKKKYPSEQWQVISCRLIPLLTHVSFRCTVPLSLKKQL
jgi:hypothetical protein